MEKDAEVESNRWLVLFSSVGNNPLLFLPLGVLLHAK